MNLVGINKGSHHSSICVIREPWDDARVEIALKERITRKKADGGTIAELLLRFAPDGRDCGVAETSTFWWPVDYERVTNQRKYYEELRKLQLTAFSARFNRKLRFVSHHLAHAMAALEFSPFRRSLIVVLDGAGHCPEVFPADHPEIRDFPPPRKKPPNALMLAESCTAYLQEGRDIRCVHKEWQTFRKRRSSRRGGPQALSDGLGMFYETAAEYLFNSKNAAGKVMGLAAFGSSRPVRDPFEFWDRMDWKQAFRGRGKQAWQQSGDFEVRADIAASVQGYYERSFMALLRRLKRKFPDQDHLVLTGGCALNCVANMKVLESGLFKSVYVLPFPGDESVALGAACWIKYREKKAPWKPRSPGLQIPCFGPVSSVPNDDQVRRRFGRYEVSHPRRLESVVARMLSEGQIVGWFQGRSESGPRALGYRSILAAPGTPGLKDHLNARIKMREAFRPYGASCTFERAREYFEIGPGFESAFMSFAPRVRKNYAATLSEVLHRDGTTRIQTVRKQQHPRFHALLREFGRLTGIYCLLNTSMNVMGEPIVETLEDAARFFDTTAVDAIVVGNLIVTRKARRPR